MIGPARRWPGGRALRDALSGRRGARALPGALLAALLAVALGGWDRGFDATVVAMSPGSVWLVSADRGTISLEGCDITHLPMYRRSRLGIGYLPQEASIFRGLNVEDNIRGVLEVVERDRKERERKLDALLEEFNITRLRKAPSIALSGGERRRCEIARALAGSPSFMLLDEPFAGIDPLAVLDIQNIVAQLRSRGIGVLITDHNVRETLGICDRAYILNDGMILEEGNPAEIAASKKAREIYLGEKFRL